MRLTLGNVRHATYQNHLERDDTHDELAAEEVEEQQGAEQAVQLLGEPEAQRKGNKRARTGDNSPPRARYLY
jgi:hypothetical protein